MNIKWHVRVSIIVSACVLCAVTQAATVFQASPGTEVFDGLNWDNGFPNTANGDGTIALDGTLNLTAPLGYVGDSGTVTVSHVAGNLTAFDVNMHNTGGSAIYHWNQSGGNLSVRLLDPNVQVIYTLSGTGKISGDHGGARVLPYNSGLFRQTGGTLINMGIDLGYPTVLELSGGTITGCGLRIPSQALWGHGSSAAVISISGSHSISFSTAVSAADVVLLQDGAQLVFAPSWSGAWAREGFAETDWITALTDPGIQVGATQVTAGNFGDLFVVSQAGASGSSIQLKAHPNPATPTLPGVTSANLVAHFDASDINNDGGATDPGNGLDVYTWSDLVSGGSLIKDVAPNFVPAGSGGISNQDTVRFSATAGGGDLLYNNGFSFSAQTVFAVATMVDNASGGLSTMVSDQNHALNIRQTTSDAAAYFSGNSGDFLIDNSSGNFHINGNPRLDIPGGYGTAHVVKAVRASAVTYSGFRFSDNVAANRRWNGDIAEVLVYDGVLDGNDTAYVNRYLAEKYAIAQVVDGRITATSQVADQPFRNAELRHVGVNFYYAPGGDTAGTLHGIGFDNINIAGGTPPSGPFDLTANMPAASLTLDCPFTVDNTPRFQATGATGTDAAVLNTVADEMFYISPSGGGHDSAKMTFSGMGKSSEVYVQVFGGDSGWFGDLDVSANGSPVGTWMSVADSNGGTGSRYCFLASTDASGRLELVFTGVNHYSGIGGLILTESVVPSQGSIFLMK